MTSFTLMMNNHSNNNNNSFFSSSSSAATAHFPTPPAAPFPLPPCSPDTLNPYPSSSSSFSFSSSSGGGGGEEDADVLFPWTFNQSGPLGGGGGGGGLGGEECVELFSQYLEAVEPPLILSYKAPARYAIPINGYLSPILVALTILNNALVCLVLLKRHMRSPTNALLVAMAISDMLTGVFPVPIFLHFFSTERFWDFIPFQWCLAYKYLAELIPTIFHTASIWLTMALAVQRYIYVCHSFRARAWCTTENVIRGTVLVYVLAFLSQLVRFLESYPVAIQLESNVDPNRTVEGCVMVYQPWVESNKDLVFNIYFWFRVVFIHLVPCISLVVLNALLIHAMRVARRRRMLLLRQNKKSESKKLKDSNCTTLMLVAVVGLFLLVELPLGVLLIIMIVSNTFKVAVLDTRTFETLSLFSNFFILLSYPLNFFIYCGMSKQFRETFKTLFTGAPLPLDREYSQYMTLPTENGKTAVTGDETAL